MSISRGQWFALQLIMLKGPAQQPLLPQGEAPLQSTAYALNPAMVTHPKIQSPLSTEHPVSKGLALSTPFLELFGSVPYSQNIDCSHLVSSHTFCYSMCRNRCSSYHHCRCGHPWSEARWRFTKEASASMGRVLVNLPKATSPLLHLHSQRAADSCLFLL